MDAEHWRRIRALFEAVVGSQPASWPDRLMDECPEDAGLRAEVLGLLEADRSVEAQPTRLSMEAPDLLGELSDVVQQYQVDTWIGRRLGSWRIERSIGRGGMGMVYLAERDDGQFEQCAALKLMRPGPDNEAVIQRFRAERQILAQLQHPHIAQLLDGGISPEGVPWFALEYVDGDTLTTVCDQRQLGVRERLLLFQDVCMAVAYAHERLIVHRDLKPGNILVDRQEQVKLLDFGIAKLLDANEAASQTSTVMRLFTPDYAAPEQIRGELVTTAVDVYALGMVLYELLTGLHPYRCQYSQPTAIAHAVLTQEPVRPSGLANRHVQTDRSGATRRAGARGLTPQRLEAQLRGDLDAVVMKALRKEPSARYGSVRELMGDVRAVLEYRPVEARRGGMRYRAGRFLRRYAIQVALTAIAILALLAGMVAARWQADVARRERLVAQGETKKAQAVADFLGSLFTQGDPTRTDGADPKASELLAKGAQELQARTDMDEATRAVLLANIGTAYQSLALSEQSLEIAWLADRSAAMSGDLSAKVAAKILLGRALINSDRIEMGLEQLAQAQRFQAADVDSDARQGRYIDYLMGVAFANLNNHPAALDHLQRAFSGAVAGSAEQGLYIEVYVNTLIENGMHDEAVVIAEKALLASKSHSDIPLIRRANFSSAAAFAHLYAGNFIEAEKYFRENLSYNEQVFGIGHVSTTRALHNVSAALRRQGRFAEAAEYAQRVLEIRRHHYPPGHSDIARAMANSGILYAEAGDCQRAIPLLSEGLLVLDPRYPPKATIMINARLSLTECYEETQDYQKAQHVAQILLPLLADAPQVLNDKIAAFEQRWTRICRRRGNCESFSLNPITSGDPNPR